MDTIARLLAQSFAGTSETLRDRQHCRVSGSTGAERLAKAAPRWLHAWLVVPAQIAINPNLYKLAYNSARTFLSCRWLPRRPSCWSCTGLCLQRTYRNSSSSRIAAWGDDFPPRPVVAPAFTWRRSISSLRRRSTSGTYLTGRGRCDADLLSGRVMMNSARSRLACPWCARVSCALSR